ncbi:MAG: hypothetical protein HQL46_08155 [Gammaproteobacteria bacterium]|nr:hypothetical protein [Gammaproteobacteria bacterium]
MFSLFQSKPVLDEDSISWLFDTFLWAEQQLDSNLFYTQTSLILPNDEFFPIPSGGNQNLAQATLDKVKEYMHMQEIPCELIEQSACQIEPIQLPEMQLALRGQKTESLETYDSIKLPIFYHPAQVRNPQAMIGYFAQTLCYFLLLYVPNKPEDVADNILQLSEVLAVFMGFGVIQANSAYNYKSTSCGSCQKETFDRNSYLSQFDITYALAIFCVIKKMDKNIALKYLKKNLKPYFKKAYQQVKLRNELGQFSNLT